MRKRTFVLSALSFMMCCANILAAENNGDAVCCCDKDGEKQWKYACEEERTNQLRVVCSPECWGI